MADFSVDDSKTRDLKMPGQPKQTAANILRDEVFDRKVNNNQVLADALDQIREHRDTNQDGLVNPGEVHAGSQTGNKLRNDLKDAIDRLAKQTEKILKETKITFAPSQGNQDNNSKSNTAKSGKQKESSAEPKAKSTAKGEKGEQKAPDRKSEPVAVNPLDVAKGLGSGLGAPTAIRIDEVGQPKGDSKLVVAASKLAKLESTEGMQQQIKDLHNDGELNDNGISANDIEDLRELPYAIEGLAKLIRDFTLIKDKNSYITDADISKYVQKNRLNEFTKTCIGRGQHHLQDNEDSGKYSKEFIQKIHNKLLNLKILD